ncbi:hypothetical protein ACP49_05570 [Clostridium botulinum]|uniref:SH3 domain-containing protein n=1 Tax=Clostridium botulinum TaxID=1491 RepID=UPI0005F93D47|nr:SH3 domain-containing protein [Clostridium botulinum]APH23530.1 bacterial SH3 domain protein [Clostridium botulinum]APQ68576.1 bacterial SH3 domain protein [Clostridium botulinum]KOM98683.1 hypothetical protein ACP53_02755 [Clostridium botulinum]KON00069.1 hypothetical protein ACP49_05570 [Clostridium botulinum]MBN3380508.1 SH3 domain-containing protein [Clostridium botulinum]
MIKKKLACALAICSFLTFTYGTTAFAANDSTNNAVQNKSVTQSSRKAPIRAVGEVTADVLNVRNSPSTSSRILGQLDNGERVNIVSLEANEDWIFIEFEGGYGWVARSYIKVVHHY